MHAATTRKGNEPGHIQLAGMAGKRPLAGKYFHPDYNACELIDKEHTGLSPGSVWNSQPEPVDRLGAAGEATHLPLGPTVRPLLGGVTAVLALVRRPAWSVTAPRLESTPQSRKR